MGILSYYHYLMDELGDPRLANDYFYGSPWPILTIIFCYLYFVRVCGPKFMKNRPPYQLDGIIKIYNIIQIAWNMLVFSYLFRLYLATSKMKVFSSWCLLNDYPDEGDLEAVIFDGTKMYFSNKVFDLLDTIFFVLRKKFNQVTFLHVYHHVAMCLVVWTHCKFINHSGGVGTATGICNAFVHIAMYTYYLLSNQGYNVWWKKYITQLQLVQFIIVLIHAFGGIYYRCHKYNFFLTTSIVLNGLFFVYLFGSFYINTYLGKTKKKNN